MTSQEFDAYNARRNTSKTSAEATPDAFEGSEAELHEQIFSECRRRGWIALHGSMSERTARTLGEPDFVVIADNGRIFLVECKSRLGKLSPAQLALAVGALKLGHKIHVVRSLEQFLQITIEKIS